MLFHDETAAAIDYLAGVLPGARVAGGIPAGFDHTSGPLVTLAPGTPRRVGRVSRVVPLYVEAWDATGLRADRLAQLAVHHLEAWPAATGGTRHRRAVETAGPAPLPHPDRPTVARSVATVEVTSRGYVPAP